jgi:alpha-tubulin suppressor-like RCC1 family protein
MHPSPTARHRPALPPRGRRMYVPLLAAVIAICALLGRTGTTTPSAALAQSPTSATAISAGRGHTCAVVGGGVHCWGDNSSGQLGDGTTTNRTRPAPVTGITTATAVSAGGAHTCAILRDTTLRCWGRNDRGQLGDGATTSRTTPVPVTSLPNVIAVAAGGAHTCVLLSAGTTPGSRVRCWGDNSAGQISDPTNPFRASHDGINVGGILTGTAMGITAGRAHSCALLNSGPVVCWGDNSSGQLGDGTTTGDFFRRTVGGFRDAVAVSAGSDHTCAIAGPAAARGVFCWGQNTTGQLGDSSTTNRTSLVLAGTSVFPVAISMNGEHSCARFQDNRVECWGRNDSGQVGDGTTTTRVDPTAVSGLTGTTLISTGGKHSCAVVGEGVVRCWGDNGLGQLGDGATTSRSTPTPIGAIAFGAAGGAPPPAPAANPAEVIAVSPGDSHACALQRDGRVKCWGDNSNGAVGDGSPINALGRVTGATARHTTPVFVAGLADVTAISASSFSTCALLRNEEVRCWGDNRFGQLGNGATTNRSTPVTVRDVGGGILRDVVAISGGGGHACALIRGGEVRCWGTNSFNQLGTSVRGDVREAVSAEESSTFGLPAVEISAGGQHTCARYTNRQIKCWGDTRFGQFGDGTFEPEPHFVIRFGGDSVAGIGNATSISSGGFHSCALVEGGSIRCWGRNPNGELGDGTTDNRGTPVTVRGISGATAVSSHGSHTCALQGGGVLCWGRNGSGRLGDGTMINRLTPVAVSGLQRVQRVSAALEHTCALLEGGIVKCWGRNDSGQLGDGTTTTRTTPVTVLMSPQPAVGVPLVPETEVTARAGEAFDYTVGWEVTEPLVWRDLDRAQIILRDTSEDGEAMVIILQEREGADSTLSADDSALVQLNTDASRIEGSGPDGRTVRLALNLTFAPEAAGKLFTVDIVVRADNGDVQIAEALGVIQVE